MAANNKDNIVGLREQILDNAQIAFGVLYKGDFTEIQFKIITALNGTQYHGRVVCGRRQIQISKSFIEGFYAKTLHEAYENLLHATSDALDRLTASGLLAHVDISEGEMLYTGIYDPEPKDD